MGAGSGGGSRFTLTEQHTAMNSTAQMQAPTAARTGATTATGLGITPSPMSSSEQTRGTSRATVNNAKEFLSKQLHSLTQLMETLQEQSAEAMAEIGSENAAEEAQEKLASVNSKMATISSQMLLVEQQMLLVERRTRP